MIDWFGESINIAVARRTVHYGTLPPKDPRQQIIVPITSAASNVVKNIVRTYVFLKEIS